MRKYYSLFFSVLLLLFACDRTNTPPGVIKPGPMTNLLTELHIVDGAMYNLMQTQDTLYKYGTGRYLALFKKFHTDSIQFKKSLKYYSNNPELLETIYEQVVVNLKDKSDSLTKLNQLQIAKDSKRREDSLKKLPKTPPVTPQQSLPVKPQPVIQPPSQNRPLHKLPKRNNAVPIK